MAGIYIHIPFCKTRCVYCDFFSDTDMSMKKRYVDAVCRELEMRSGELQNLPVETIYFGGGTPSQLQRSDFDLIFDTLERVYGLDSCLEITLEANPDDLTADYIGHLRDLPFNRISMGVQSFNDRDLKFLNRRHTSVAAIQAVENCQRAGFDNISIDLMYGLPGQTIDEWESTLNQALSLDVQHISSYHLIYEEGTRLYRLMDEGKVREVDEEVSLDMFRLLIGRLTTGGYEHYEISNFARPGYLSRHNTSYWQDIPYLGIGASAHSYNGRMRQWNVSAMRSYISGILKGEIVYELETIDEDSRYNELVLTSLRTMWGLNLHRVEQLFGSDRLRYCLQQAGPYLDSGHLKKKDSHLIVTPEGVFISDGIMSDMLYVK